MNIKSIVQMLVKKYKTNDPFELVSYLKIHVYFRQMHEEVYGLYQYCDRNKFIYINSNLSYNAQRFNCGHELGHAVLHPKLNCTFLKQYTLFSPNKYENEANIFSSHLLLSDEIIQQYEGFTVDQISIATGIPKQYLLNLL